MRKQGDHDKLIWKHFACIHEHLTKSLQWRHNEWYGVLNHKRHDCLRNRLFKAQIEENIKAPCQWSLGNSPVAGKFPAQRASNAEMFPFDDVIMCVCLSWMIWMYQQDTHSVNIVCYSVIV